MTTASGYLERTRDREREGGEAAGERTKDREREGGWGEELQEEWIKERGPQGKAPAGVLSKLGCGSRERPRSNI